MLLPAVESLAAQHRVEPLDAGGNAFVATLRVRAAREVTGQTEMPSSSMRNGYSLVPCVAAAIFDHAQPPGRDLIDDAMVEQDHAIGDVFLQAVAGQRAFAALARDDDRDAFVLEPAKEPAELCAHDRLIGQPGEKRFDRVEHDALRLDGIDRVAKPDEEAFEIVFARLLEFAALDVDVIEQQLLARRPAPSDRIPARRHSRSVPRLVSSNAMKTPGSPYSMAPCTRNSIASNVLPQPAPPQTSVGRPAGNPPPVISSSPRIPVGDFRKVFRSGGDLRFFHSAPSRGGCFFKSSSVFIKGSFFPLNSKYHKYM